ncbi:MAG: caspase family protein [Deltaproteobacteria bacterium]|nr:caspase family protein [Deltaproteobacteria bacterium]
MAAHSPAFAEQRYALVIGSNPGWSQDRPLRYADNDAERVRDVLVALGGFPADRVNLMRDPSTADVRGALRRLADVARDSTGEDTLVFVYYSGHADNKHLHLRGDPMSHKELQDTLRSLPATIKLGVVDACKSGSVTRKGASQTDEFVVDVVHPKLSGMVLLSSSGADELSQESRALQGSVFTHHLVSGLRGAADEDNDQQVSITEAYHYAYSRTRAATSTSSVQQRPAFRYELSGQGELMLTKLKTNKNVAMIVPKGPAQKYVVLDAHEWRLIAETTSEKARDITLALAPGTYRVKRVHEDRLEVASLVVAAGGRSDLSKLTYTDAPLSAGIITKGDPGDLTPSEHRDYRRQQAFGFLANGQTAPAVALFDQLIREDRGDMLAWRGRGRALVRIAEAYERVNDHKSERLALADALKADPSLSEDPLFAIWYQRLGELDARERVTVERKDQFQRDVTKNPRTYKKYGVGFDLISTRGLLTINATKVIHRMFFPTIALDFAGPGLDFGITIAPLPSRWSPYLGFGAHVSAKKLGLDIYGGGMGTAGTNDTSYSTEDIWGLHGRIEGGVQFVSNAGFTTELGLGMMVFKTTATATQPSKTTQQLWPVFHLGWLW